MKRSEYDYQQLKGFTQHNMCVLKQYMCYLCPSGGLVWTVPAMTSSGVGLAARLGPDRIWDE